MGKKNCRNLIVRVDELNGEIEILREDLNSMSQGKTKSEAKVKELEVEIKQLKSEEEKRKNDEKEGDYVGVGCFIIW